jgi:hypothetical protein
VHISTEVSIIVTDDNKVTCALDATASIHNITVCSGIHRLTSVSGDIDPPGGTGLRESAQ